MLFAAFEIMIFLLLAALLGGAAGWWLARSVKVSVAKAMDRSGAHAAADRELEIARAEIVRLNSKLRVATDAIRELERSNVAAGNGEMAHLGTIPAVPAAPAELDPSPSPVPGEAVSEPVASSGGESRGEDPAERPDQDPPELEADDAADAASALDADTATEAADQEDPPPVPAEDGTDRPVPASRRTRGGKRLSSRVADASAGVTFERPAPTIRFDDPSD